MSIGDELDCNYVSAGPAGRACASEAVLLTNEHVGPVVALNGRGESVVAAGDQDTAGDEETFGLLADEVRDGRRAHVVHGLRMRPSVSQSLKMPPFCPGTLPQSRITCTLRLIRVRT